MTGRPNEVPPASDPRAEAISVDGRVVSEEEIAREMQHHPASNFDEAHYKAALALVVRELLLAESQRLALGGEGPATEKSGFEEAIERLLEREVHIPEADFDTCRRYYEQNKERFRSPDLFEASHILFPAAEEDTQARALAREKSEAVLLELKKRPGRFAELAREHSACSSAAEGGMLGQITRGQTAPEFEAALDRLNPGEHTAEPVSTRYGLHIINLHRKVDGRELPFSLVKEQIAEYLQTRAWNQAVHQYISILAGRAELRGIELDAAASPLVQ